MHHSSKTPVKQQYVKSKLLQHFEQWKGVKYQLGGETKRGVDCSAFVQIAFREKFGVELPRITQEQKKIGKSIPNQKHLVVGDLLLFRDNKTGNHIGIYIGNNQFLHASTSQGVMISNINNRYWKQRYKDARRILAVRTG